MDVAIFGAGIAGLMSAITLRAQGHQCTVYERSHQAQDGGMGYIMLPEGIACLENFGVQMKGPLGGVELDSYSCRDATGEIVCEQAMPKGTRGIRRRDLVAALLAVFGEEDVVNAELNDLEFDQEFHVIAARLQSRNGGTRLKADLYVGADGMNSRARPAIFPNWPTLPDRILEMVGLVRCDKAVQWAGSRWNKFHAGDGGIAFGIVPVDGQHVVWYLQFDSARYPLPTALPDQASRAGARRAFAQNLVGSWAHPVPSLLAATDFGRVHLWRPVDAELVPRFHRGNLVLVGDAAHPLSPFTSQGVVSAIADAVVLAKEMHGISSASEMNGALARYSRQRREDCVPYYAKGRQLSADFLAPLSASSAILPIAVKGSEKRFLSRSLIQGPRQAHL